MKTLPWILVLLRAVLAPLLVLLVFEGAIADRGLFAIYLVASASDVADGKIARALGVATPRLRAADSAADTVFHLAVAGATFLLHPSELASAFLPGFLLTGAVWYGLDAVRWRRVAGFHSKLSRVFAATLVVWAVLLYGFSIGGTLGLPLLVGTLANVEGVAISLTITRDRKDVPSFFELQRRCVSK